jgi:cell division protein FtsB
VSRRSLVFNCRTFEDSPTLLTSAYQVRSEVDPATFQAFARAISGDFPQVTSANVADLSLLCSEFGFTSLSQRVAAFLREQRPAPEGPDAAQLVEDMREQLFGHERTMSLLQKENHRLQAEVADLRAAVAELAARPSITDVKKELDAAIGRGLATVAKRIADEIARISTTQAALSAKQQEIEAAVREITAREAAFAREIDDLKGKVATSGPRSAD